MNDLTSHLLADQKETWDQSYRLATVCEFEESHALQVTFLAVRIFDELAGLHKLGSQDRFRLQLAGLLHDIGWLEGWKSHHKSSLSIILSSPMLPFDHHERMIIGSVCRYHRRALPDEKHDHYAALDPAERKIVCKLASILRVADGLDCTHRGLVRDLGVQYDQGAIRITCQCSALAFDEQNEALNKGDLMELTFNRKLVVLREKK